MKIKTERRVCCLFGYIKAALKGFLEMKVLIAYSTHTGCCADCAEILGQALANYEVDIADLSEREPNPEDYDIIVVGSGIKRRKFYRESADFIKKYTDLLCEKPSAYFICSAYNDSVAEMFKKNISRKLRCAAICLDTFGGELRIDRLKGFDKFTVKSIKHALLEAAEHESSTGDGEFASVLPAIVPENIHRFADIIRSALGNV